MSICGVCHTSCTSSLSIEDSSSVFLFDDFVNEVIIYIKKECTVLYHKKGILPILSYFVV
jgi:hypothetical protein